MLYKERRKPNDDYKVHDFTNTKSKSGRKNQLIPCIDDSIFCKGCKKSSIYLLRKCYVYIYITQILFHFLKVVFNFILAKETFINRFNLLYLNCNEYKVSW